MRTILSNLRSIHTCLNIWTIHAPNERLNSNLQLASVQFILYSVSVPLRVEWNASIVDSSKSFSAHAERHTITVRLSWNHNTWFEWTIRNSFEAIRKLCSAYGLSARSGYVCDWRIQLAQTFCRHSVHSDEQHENCSLHQLCARRSGWNQYCVRNI